MKFMFIWIFCFVSLICCSCVCVCVHGFFFFFGFAFVNCSEDHVQKEFKTCLKWELLCEQFEFVVICEFLYVWVL